MITDDRSKIEDLGKLTWEELEKVGFLIPEPYPAPTRERKLKAIVGHIYLIRVADRETDLTALLRVEDLIPDDRVQFSWRVLKTDDGEAGTE